MGIFKSITKVLKKAAPIIGGTIGFAVGGPLGASIGSGIGSLAGGRSVEEALLNAGLSYGVGSFAKGAGFGPQGTSAGTYGASTGASNVANVSGPEIMSSVKTTAPVSQISSSIPTTASKAISSVFDFAKENPLLTAGGVGTLLAGSMEEQQPSSIKMQPYPVGKTRLGTGRIGNKLYNLDDPNERRQYFEDNRKRQGAEDIEPILQRRRLGGIADFKRLNNFELGLVRDRDDFTEEEKRMAIGILATRPKLSPRASFGDVPDGMMTGGEVKGPGTGTSDSVPARLSDGEFVVTAKAVRGAGGGDRDVGAARMYDMMSQLERVA